MVSENTLSAKRLARKTGNKVSFVEDGVEIRVLPCGCIRKYWLDSSGLSSHCSVDEPCPKHFND